MGDLEFDAVSKRWDDGSYALREVSLSVSAEKLTTVLGPSGCGKSTLLRAAAGLEALSAGSIRIDGVDVRQRDEAARGVGLMFQSVSLFPHLSVLDNVGFGLRMSGLPKRDLVGRSRAMLDMVGLRGMEQRSTSELSGGEQQRVALARALALEPSVVLLDEPLSSLDAGLKHQLRDEIRSLQQRLGVTMAYVTHDETEAMAVSDYIAVMNNGRLVQIGTPRDVYERPNCEFVAAFMGEATFLDVTVDTDGCAQLGPFRLHVGDAGRWTGAARVMVRPHAWRILAVGAHGLPGRVARCTYLGHGVEYRVDTDLGSLLVSTDSVDALHQAGAPVTLALDGRDVSVFRAEPAETNEPPACTTHEAAAEPRVATG